MSNVWVCDTKVAMMCTVHCIFFPSPQQTSKRNKKKTIGITIQLFMLYILGPSIKKFHKHKFTFIIVHSDINP